MYEDNRSAIYILISAYISSATKVSLLLLLSYLGKVSVPEDQQWQ